jgi:hypothetical protein
MMDIKNGKFTVIISARSPLRPSCRGDITYVGLFVCPPLPKSVLVAGGLLEELMVPPQLQHQASGLKLKIRCPITQIVGLPSRL